MPDFDQILIAGTIFGAAVLLVLILVVNDRQKRKLVEKAWDKGSRPNRKS